MSQIHPIDAGMALHEQTKCLIGLAEKIKRQRKYGEQCILDATTSANYLNSHREPEQLIQTAIQLIDSARLDILSNDQVCFNLKKFKHYLIFSWHVCWPSKRLFIPNMTQMVQQKLMNCLHQVHV